MPAAALLLAFLLPFFAPQPAYAYVFSEPNTIGSDGTVCPGTGLTSRIVPCIKENLLTATDNFLLPFAGYFATLDWAACVLAIALWGLLVAGGKKQALTRDGYILALKLMVIVFATANFTNWFSDALDIVDEMIGFVSTYAVNFSSLASNPACVGSANPSLAVWSTVDCTLQILIGGIFNPSTLMLGIGGFFFACLLSSTLGMLIALLGAYLIGCLLLTVARALYVFISAYIGMAVMFIILPIILPTILFTVTKPYFDKWLRLTLTFIVQPVVLFAYLAMLVAAFDTVVYTGPNSLYRAIAGPAVNEPGFEMGTWLLGLAYSDDEIGGVAIPVDAGAMERELGPGVPLNQGPMAEVASVADAQSADWEDGIFHWLGIGDNGLADALYDEPNLPVTAIDWKLLAATQGLNVTTYTVNLLLALFMAVVTAYMLFKLLDFIPYIGAGIAGIPIGMPVFGVANAGGIDMSPPGSRMLDKLQSKLADKFQGSMQSKSRPPVGGGGGG